MQNSILTLFIILTIVIILFFFLVFQSSKKQTEEGGGIKNALRKRFWFILILVVTLGITASITIPKSPYYIFADEQPSKIIYVAAGQFYFMMSYDAIDPKSPSGVSNIEIEPNELVEFRVTSLDVNHDFAIYDKSNTLIAQTQAMPGYVNRLRWKFKDPGEYNVFCLEFCGVGHQIMKTSFTVK